VSLDASLLERVALPGVALPARWAGHPVVVAENARHGWDVTHVWSDDDALLVRLRWRERADGDRPFAVEAADDAASASLLSVGTPDGAARLLLRAAADLEQEGTSLASATRSSVPRGTRATLAAMAVADPGLVVPAPFDVPTDGAWDWMGTTSDPPAQPGQERVEELLGDVGLAEARAARERANPHGELSVDEPRSRWWGWRDDDGVVRGVVGASRRLPGQPWVLGSIGTDPGWRGRGIAAATTAVATRAGLAEVPMVTLGLYADNHTARRLYARLGYELTQEFESHR
jgi:RimJ/RimL family protein N-acetyltransferase